MIEIDSGRTSTRSFSTQDELEFPNSVLSNKPQSIAFHRKQLAEFYLQQKTSKVFPEALQEILIDKQKDSKIYLTCYCNATYHKNFIKFKPYNNLMPTETMKPQY